MSHFPVFVICHSDDGDQIHKLLAPFQEGNEADLPPELLAFESEDAECRASYTDSTYEMVRTPDGEILSRFNDRFWAKKPNSSCNGFELPNDCTMISIPANILYPSYDDFAESAGYRKNPDSGEYGYWLNPNAKWDWYSIGGRFSGMLPLLSGGTADIARVKNIQFGPVESRVKSAERFWEIVVEGAELRPGEEKPFTFFKPEYFINRYGTKEGYSHMEGQLHPWSFITPDGEWHEQGEMGWFAISDATAESIKAFGALWEKTIAEADPEDFVVVVDCHI